MSFLISGCSGGGGGDANSSSKLSETGSASFTIAWHNAPVIETSENSLLKTQAKAMDRDLIENIVQASENGLVTAQAEPVNCDLIENIICEVYDGSNTYLTSEVFPCSAGQGTIDNIPAGEDRAFVILGQDVDGNILYHGELSGITITAGETNDLGIIDVYSFVPTLFTPADGENVTVNSFSLIWDSVENAHAYNILVSEDDNFGTTIIDETIPNTEYTPSDLSALTTYYWKVFARDIHANQGADSEVRSFTTNVTINEIPTATISAPTSGDTFTVGDTITFSGTGYDTEDGTLTGDSLVWMSSIDGQIGTGTSFSTPSLSGGNHTITLTATDFDGATGTDSVSITVNLSGNTSPSATISAPTSGDTFTVGDTITFSGTGDDTEDGTLTGDSLVWISSIDGQIDTGTSFSTAGLSAGNHTITLTATDFDGATGTDSVSITVNLPGNTCPVANAGPGQTVFFGDTVTLDGSGSTDVDEDLLTYSWSLTTVPEGSEATLSDPTAVNPSFEVDVSGIYVAQLIVNDGTCDSDPHTVTISAEASPNVGPAIFNPAWELIQLNDPDCNLYGPPVGSLFLVTFDYTDPDGNGPTNISQAKMEIAWVFPGSDDYDDGVFNDYIWHSLLSSDGNSDSGTAITRQCYRFGSNGYVDVTMTIEDLIGAKSNPLGVRITKPDGSN